MLWPHRHRGGGGRRRRCRAGGGRDAASGRDCLLLEARDHIGGRAHTDRRCRVHRSISALPTSTPPIGAIHGSPSRQRTASHWSATRGGACCWTPAGGRRRCGPGYGRAASAWRASPPRSAMAGHGAWRICCRAQGGRSLRRRPGRAMAQRRGHVAVDALDFVALARVRTGWFPAGTAGSWSGSVRGCRSGSTAR